MAAPLDVRPADLDGLRDEWRALQQAAGHPFATWEWARAWCDHLLDGEPLVVACRRGDGALAAVLALEVRRERGLRVARWLGHGPADELGPVCAPEDRAAVAAALRSLPGFDVLRAEALPADADWEPLLRAQPADREASPVVDLAGFADWEGWLASRSSNFRSQVRARERRLAREAELAIRASDDPRDLEAVIALHERRWEGTSTAFAGPRGRFHRAFAQAAATEGWLRIRVLSLDGRDVAAWYGLRYAGQEWFYQSGREPDAPGSVGFVLLAHTLREALEDGCSAYRLGRGGEDYKARFADRDPGLVTLDVAATRRGRLALAAVALRRQMRAG